MRAVPASRTRIRTALVIAGLWALPGLLSTPEVLQAAERRGVEAGFLAILAFQLLRYAAFAALTPAVYWLAGRFPLRRPGLATRLPVHLGAAAAFAFIHYCSFVFVELIHPLAPESRVTAAGFAAGFTRFWPEPFIGGVFIYFLLLGISLAVHYYHRNRQRDLQAAELERELADARLTALRMQLNPHFLFNTLHAVSSLMEEDATAARAMIARLSELLRLTLEETHQQEISLRRELDVLEKYLEIEEIRFQDRLRVKMSIEPNSLEAQVPSLVLQPIVENAIRHGIARRASAGRLEVGAKRVDGRLELTVSDNGPGMAQGSPEGIGLTNVRSRLKHLYGPGQRVEMTNGDAGVTVRLSLPFRTPAATPARADDPDE